MDRRRYGLLTEEQYKVLKLRLNGLTQREIAEILKTSRENVAILEKRAKRNIKLAEETLNTYKSLLAVAKVEIKEGTHLVDVPRLVIDAADKAKVKLKANFTRIYDEIRFKAGDHVKGTYIVKPITILIFKNGDVDVVKGKLKKTKH